MNIVIARDDQTFGPYSRDQVADLLEQGELSPGDLASWEGGGDWQSLNELLSLSSASEQMDVREDGENEDDFDHEKMKQWEDVFVDDEDGFEDDEQFVDESLDQDVGTPAVSTQPSVSHSSEIVDEQATPPISTPIETTSAVDDSVDEDLPPPPPPPVPAAAPSPATAEESKPQAKEKDSSARPSPITPRSKKIKGLNSRQTVIVVKRAGIFSKICTISLVFLILAVLSYLVAFALVTWKPEEIGPKLERIGISLELFGQEGKSGDLPVPPKPSSAPPSDPPDSGGGTNDTGTK
jgi:hypothetical protein